VHRRYHHEYLTFRGLYQFTENFVLPLSHDEVVYGKGSLLGRMPGDEWQRYANLRLLFAWMHAQPGKKLLFMGGEFGQWNEWNHDGSLDWHLVHDPLRAGLLRCVGDLNRFHRSEPAMHALDFSPEGFEWVDANDSEQSVASLLRLGGGDVVLAVCNFTPVPRPGYRVGVPRPGRWAEVLNTDSESYGGSGWGNFGGLDAIAEPWHGRPWSLTVTVPPLAGVFLKATEGAPAGRAAPGSGKAR
jgi:1,4-alpha-glucan branching enzyme